MGHSKYKFKSVGNRSTSRRFGNTTNDTKVRNIGIKTPVRSSGTTEIFDMHTDFKDQLKDNLKNLILTNQGERLCRHNFGANLKSVLYDFTKEEQYLNIVKNMINRAVQVHMPVIQITDINAVVLSDLEKNKANLSGLAKLKLRVVFSIPKIQITNLAIEVEMFIGG